jgi:polar amino acid transport system substrate-binding protein
VRHLLLLFETALHKLGLWYLGDLGLFMFKHLFWMSTVCLTFLSDVQARDDCPSLSLAFYELGALYYRVEGEQFTGIDKDVVDEIERRRACKFQTRLDSRVRIWSQLQEGSLALSVSGIATPERQVFAHFIPYFSTRNYVILREDMAKQIASLAEFSANPKLMVAVVKSFKHGAIYDVWLAQLRKENRVIEAADFDTVFRLLLAKRVHAILALPTSSSRLLVQHKMDHLKLLRDWAPNDRLVHGLIVSKARVSDVQYQELRQILTAMREDGSLERIFQRHIGAKIAKEMRLEE